MRSRMKAASPKPSAMSKAKRKPTASTTSLLASLLDCIPDPALVVGAQNARIVHSNVAALQWYGGRKTGLTGKPFLTLCPETNDESRNEWLGKVQVHGQVFAEQSFRLADGRIVRADLSASTLKGEGLDGLVIAILRDAEARLAAQQQEIRAREIAARLATVERISHEINNPLQALILRPTCTCHDEVQCHVDAIANAVRRLRAEESAGPPEPQTAQAAPTAAPRRTPTNEKRFLIADDTDVIREALSLLLARAFPGVQVDKAADGEEAVAKFKKHHPAVMVLDMVMPRKTGDTAFAEIRDYCRKNNLAEPRIVFCTGYTPPPSILAAARGTDRLVCMLKPVPPEDLIEAVRRMARLGGRPR